MKAFLYLPIRETQRSNFQSVYLNQMSTAQIFMETNAINCVGTITDICDWRWNNRRGMKLILSKLSKNPAVKCVVVYEYRNLIFEQSDFDALKRKLNSMNVQLIPVKRGEIEIESEYYFNPDQ